MILINFPLNVDGFVLLKLNLINEALRLKAHIYLHDSFVIDIELGLNWIILGILIRWLYQSLVLNGPMYIQKVLFPQGVHVEHFKQKIIVCVDVIVVQVYREHQRALYHVLAYFDHLFSLQTHA